MTALGPFQPAGRRSPPSRRFPVDLEPPLKPRCGPGRVAVPGPRLGGRQEEGSGLHVGAGPGALVVGEPDLRGVGLWQMIDTKLGEVSC